MKVIKQTKDYNPEGLLQFGIDHLRASKFLYSETPLFYDSAGYLSQLGIELLLKAWLLYLEGSHPPIHGLIELWNRIVLRHPVSLQKANLEWMKELHRHYKLRYPLTDDPIETATDDWNKTEELFNEICLLMPAPLQNHVQDRNLDTRYTIKGNRILMRKPKAERDH